MLCSQPWGVTTWETPWPILRTSSSYQEQNENAKSISFYVVLNERETLQCSGMRCTCKSIPPFLLMPCFVCNVSPIINLMRLFYKGAKILLKHCMGMFECMNPVEKRADCLQKGHCVCTSSSCISLPDHSIAFRNWKKRFISKYKEWIKDWGDEA